MIDCPKHASDHCLVGLFGWTNMACRGEHYKELLRKSVSEMPACRMLHKYQDYGINQVDWFG